MVSVSLRMPKSLAGDVAAAAHRKGVSKSALIREAIDAFLDGEGAGGPESALDLVLDLAGSCEGPEDLSTNRKHMQGFGE